MDCLGCGHENPDRAKFCLECGAAFAVRCSSCQTELPAGAKFCLECGEPVGSRQDTVAQPERDARAYTPKHLAEKILNSRAALEGERKQVTVLFADIQGSMHLADRLDPEEWHQVLDGFFAILTEGVHRFEGTINQYTGDGIMALFGAPIAHEDHAQRACYAALQLRDALRQQSVVLRMERGLDFGVRIGVNSGAVVVGRIGDDLRMDYTAQGHTVGVAQRLEQLAEPGHVYISEHTARLAHGYFALTDVGTSKLKGGAETIGVFDLEDTTAATTRMDVSRARGLTRFVGRGDEMALLTTALGHAKAGNGQVVGVVGEAGLGKSRLCLEFVERCRREGVPVYEGHCPAHGKSIPFIPIRELLRSYFALSDQDSPDQARQKIAGMLTLLDPSLHDALPVLFDFLGLGDANRAPVALDADARQRQLFDITHRIVRVQHQRGVASVTLIDDLHWIDDWSDAYVAQLVEAAQTSHMLLVLNFRPEYQPRWSNKAYYQQLPLVPLGVEAIREMIQSLLGDEASVAALAERILRWTDGNPLYSEEVINTLIETGQLEGVRGAYVLARPVEALEVPPNVQALIGARIDRLEEHPKRLLQHASVVGKECSRPLLEAITDVSPADIAAAIDRLKEGDFIFEAALYPVVEYSFKHPLIHEVAYETQLKNRRAETHAKVAVAIEALQSGRLDEFASMLAYHWELAGVPEKAFEWHRRAAAIGELNDARAAAEHWLKVLSHFETLEPTDEIMSIAAQAYGRLNAIGWRIGGTSEEDAKRRYEEGKALAQRIGDRRLLTMLTGSYSIQRGVNLGFANDYARLAQGSVAMADELDDPELQCAMRMWMVAGYLHSGRLREAIQCARETVTRIPEDLPFGSQYVGFPLRPGILLTQGLAHALAGEAAVAKDVWRRSRSEGQEVADVRIVTNGMESVTDGLYGATESASVLGEAAVSEADAMGTDYALVMGLWGLARAHAGAGRLADAEETCVRALELMESRNTGRMHLGGLAAVLAEVELRQGRPGQALTRARDTVDFCRLRGAYVDLSPWLVLAQAHTANGDRDGALTALDETQQLVRQTDARIFHPFLHERRAEFAEAFDADWSAEDERREAHRLFVELGAIGHSIRLEKNFAV